MNVFPCQIVFIYISPLRAAFSVALLSVSYINDYPKMEKTRLIVFLEKEQKLRERTPPAAGSHNCACFINRNSSLSLNQTRWQTESQTGHTDLLNLKPKRPKSLFFVKTKMSGDPNYFPKSLSEPAQSETRPLHFHKQLN